MRTERSGDRDAESEQDRVATDVKRGWWARTSRDLGCGSAVHLRELRSGMW